MLFFSTESHGGHVQLAQFEGRPDYFTCELTPCDAPERDPVELQLASRASLRIEFCDELPYSETGKLLRRVVREQLAAST